MVFKNCFQYIHKTIMEQSNKKENPFTPQRLRGREVEVPKALIYCISLGVMYISIFNQYSI